MSCCGPKGQAAWLKHPQPIPPSDINLAVAAGDVTGTVALHKFGRNPDVDTTTDPETVWGNGGVWVPPTQARQHSIASSSASDAPAGIGALTITIQGLDANFDEIEEDITMNGATPVTSSKSYTRIHRMFVLTVGTNLRNVGTITATAITDATVSCAMDAEKGQTLHAIYTVPAGKTLYLDHIYASLNKSASTSTAAVELQTRDVSTSGTAWRVRRHMGIHSTSGVNQAFFTPALKVSEKHDIQMYVVEVSASNSDISAGFDGFLVDD